MPLYIILLSYLFICFFSHRANLAHDYFTNRQDRYVLFKNSPQLADHFSSLADILCDHSFQIDADNVSHVPTATNTNPLSSLKQTTAYKQSLHNCVSELSRHTFQTNNLCSGVTDNKMNLDFSWKELCSSIPGADTLVFPLLQMGQYGIRQDELVTRHLLSGATEGENVHLATGYFNPPTEYVDAILTSRGRYRLLAAAPEVRAKSSTQLPVVLIVDCQFIVQREQIFILTAIEWLK